MCFGWEIGLLYRVTKSVPSGNYFVDCGGDEDDSLEEGMCYDDVLDTIT
jgi:hypothetical protein